MPGPLQLPEPNYGISTSKAPAENISPAQVAQPYGELAAALDKTGHAFEDISSHIAEQEGAKSVTRDADGNIQVAPNTFFGKAALAYKRTSVMAGLADADGAAERDVIKLREQFRDQPDLYEKAAGAYKTKAVQDFSSQFGPEAAISLSKAIDSKITTTYRGLLNEKESLDLHRADKSIVARIKSAEDDATALARGGAPLDGPDLSRALDTIQTLRNERVANPRLAYPKDLSDFEQQQFDGALGANRFLYNVGQKYKDPKVDVDQRASTAIEYARGILSDPNLKLTQAQREHYYHTAVSEIHANEGLRRQNVFEVRQAEHDLTYASMLGLPIAPEDVNRVGDAYRKLGAFSDEARLYAQFARKPLNDAFGQQLLAVQAGQVAALRGAALGPEYMGAIKESEGFRPKAYRDVKQFSIGYGTRATSPDEAIDRPEAERRFNTEIARAAAVVDQVNPNLPPGARAALTSLTFNAGADWVNSELGQRVRAGDLEGAKARFLQYNQSGGQINPVLVERRRGEAQWFGGVLPPAGEPTPAQSLWLSANRSRVVQDQSRKSWVATVKEWDEKGVAPADNTVTSIMDAARATGDHDLLETISHDLARIEAVQQSARGPLAAQHAQIAEIKAEGAAGGFSVGNAAVIKDLEKKYAAITEGLKTNPIATTVQNFPDKFNASGPLDLGDDGKMIAGLRYRNQIAGFAGQNWGGEPRSALDAPDLAALKGALDHADPATKARIFGNLATGLTDEKVRNTTLAKLGEGGGAHMTEVFASTLPPDVARGIFNGQQAIKADKRYDPMGEEGGHAKLDFHTELDKRFPPTAFGLQGRSDPAGPYATMVNAIRARYADLAATAGKPDDHIDKDRLQRSIDDVTGGVLSHNGGSFIAPRRGMPQGQFDAVIGALTDADLAGVTTLAGESVTAGYLRGSAQLETVGDGRYLVRLGRDPERPVYAFRWAGTEAPQPFVLDLRGRTATAPFRAPSFQPGG